jgi:tetratricopeptide (TPR) repeat protein
VVSNHERRRWPIGMAAAIVLGVPALVSAHPGLDELRRAADVAVALSPAEPQPHLQRARVLELQREWDAALAELNAAAAYGADADAVGATRVSILLAAGRSQAALREIDRVLPHRPDAYWLVFDRGRALLALGQARPAAQDFGRAIAAMPAPQPEHVFAQRDALLSLGDRAAAVTALDAGMARIGRVASLQLAAVDLEVELGRTDDALRRLDELIEREGRNPVWIAQRGDILRRAGRDAAARAEYERALALIEARPAMQRVKAFEALKQRLRTALAPAPIGGR